MATETKDEIRELIGKSLEPFRIAEMTEVYVVNEDGRRCNSVGFFNNQDVATAFAGIQTDSNYHHTSKSLVLTDGKIGWVIPEQVPVKIFKDEVEMVKIKKKALEKISPAERKILGLE